MDTEFPTRLTVEVDTREKTPFQFPSTIPIWDAEKRSMLTIATIRTKLDAGDYRIKEFPASTIVERKGHPLEFALNICGPDWRRQKKALDKLVAACNHPLLALESTPPTIYRALERESHLPSRGPLLPDPNYYTQRMARLLCRYPLQLCFLGSCNSTSGSRLAGQFLLSLMLGYILSDIQDGYNVSTPPAQLPPGIVQ